MFKSIVEGLKTPEGQEQVEKVKELTKLAEEGKRRRRRGAAVEPGRFIYLYSFDFIYNLSNYGFFFFLTELQTTVSALALAWVAKNPNTSTVILGASKPEQIIENLKAIEIIPKLTPELLHKIEKILDNEPDAHVRFDALFI